MSNEILERFRNLDEMFLLHSAAFEMHNYSEPAREQLRIALAERHIDEKQIIAYRSWRFSKPTLEFDCPNCSERLTVEREELESGKFTCPECHKSDWVPYPEMAPVEFDPETDIVHESETADLQADAGSQDSDLLPPNPVAEMYGQRSSVPNLATDQGKQDTTVRYLDEGLPETRCAKCGIVIGAEETFLGDDDEFYCEKCIQNVR